MSEQLEDHAEEGEELDEDEERELDPPANTSTSRPTTPTALKVEKGRRKPKDVGTGILEYLKNKQDVRQQQSQQQEKEDPDRMFLLSLLPEMKEMSKQAKASFKIKVLQASQEVQIPIVAPPAYQSAPVMENSGQYNSNVNFNSNTSLLFENGNTYQQM